MEGMQINKIILFMFFSVIYFHMAVASENKLTVISSADPGSRKEQSFVVVKIGEHLPEGIKNSAKERVLALQIPFIIELKDKINQGIDLQWIVTVSDKKYGGINMLSKIPGNLIKEGRSLVWESEKLNKDVIDRQKIVFRPAPKSHQTSMYKKGKLRFDERSKYGGGTREINDQNYNPRLRYGVELRLLHKKELIKKYQTVLEMDNKDMIRQEYINHFNIKRYGRGGNGNLPVPMRSEISKTPGKLNNISGNPLTESKYKLLVNDGMQTLAENIASIYELKKQQLKHSSFLDMKGKALKVPNSQLWLSGGWRNPERNEWYSHALNGVHQRGGAIDLIIREPPGNNRSAIAYWVLWKSLEDHTETLNAFWQLESHGRPMRTDEFRNDIEPENGIPDAFDKADHLHANIKYEPK